MAESDRHQSPDRAFHWVMAVLVVILLATAFLPILGLQFNWVTIHWVSGVFLIISVLFHLYRSIFILGLSEMLPRVEDLRYWLRGDSSIDSKYDLGQKLYHWAIAVIMLTLLITGAIMLAKIDTPLWNRDPSILNDNVWGVIYVFHGAASYLLIFFFILHVYFSFLPEHRDLLLSMLRGNKK